MGFCDNYLQPASLRGYHEDIEAVRPNRECGACSIEKFQAKICSTRA